MRRQKRNDSKRAFSKGYFAGLNGRSKEECPSQRDEIRQSWLSGWREGREDQWSGFTGVSGIHRRPI